MLVEQFDLKTEDLGPDVQLESLGLDSLSVIEFMFTLEDELKIKLSNDYVELKTVGDVVNEINKIITEQKDQVK